MWFYGREFPAQKPIFTNGLTSQVYIAPGKLSEPQSGSDLILSLQALMKYFFNLYCTIVDGVLTEKKNVLYRSLFTSSSDLKWFNENDNCIVWDLNAFAFLLIFQSPRNPNEWNELESFVRSTEYAYLALKRQALRLSFSMYQSFHN